MAMGRDLWGCGWQWLQLWVVVCGGVGGSGGGCDRQWCGLVVCSQIGRGKERIEE